MINQMERRQIGTKRMFDTAVVVGKTLLEPLHSAYVWIGAHDKGIWGRKLNESETLKDENFPKFFNHHKEEEIKFLELSNVPSLLGEINTCFTNEKGEPQSFIGRERFETWKFVKKSLNEGLSERIPGVEMVDYVASSQAQHLLFFVHDNELKAVKVDGKKTDFSLDYVEAQLKDGKLRATIPTNEGDAPEWLVSSVGISKSDLETTISSLVERTAEPVNYKTREINSITNDFYYKRHTKLEREGLFFTGLRHMGAHSIGEMQCEGRVLFDEGWKIDTQNEEVKIDDRLLERWVSIRNLPFERFDNQILPEQREMARNEAIEYITEQAYFRLILEKLKDSELVKSFVRSDVYKKYAIEFKDRHAASYGATEIKTAESMIAGAYLLLFEGVPHPLQSPSQSYMAEVPGYHKAVLEYLEQYKGSKPDFSPKVIGRTVDEKSAIVNELIKTFKEDELVSTGLTEIRCSNEILEKVLEESETCMVHAKGEMYRNPVHRKVIEVFHNFGLIVSDGARSRVGMGDTFIGNLMLRSVDIYGERRFTFPWIKRASGYLGADRERELPALTEETSTPITEVFKDIFSGEVDELGHPYLTQEAKVFKHAGTILKYMGEDTRAPLSVRKFVQSLSSRESLIKVLETMGSIGDNDPNIVNRFFPNGVGEFQLASIYRYVFDFVRGVESNLVLAQGEQRGGIHKLAAFADMWAGNWRNRDFRNIDDKVISEAVTETFKDGHSRLIELNHAVGDINKMAKALGLDSKEMEEVSKEEYSATWKTLQEKLEVVFGWDTTGMKYLRWQELWNVWNTLGAAWDCICFTRKTIFNPKPLKATY